MTQGVVVAETGIGVFRNPLHSEFAFPSLEEAEDFGAGGRGSRS